MGLIESRHWWIGKSELIMLSLRQRCCICSLISRPTELDFKVAYAARICDETFPVAFPFSTSHSSTSPGPGCVKGVNGFGVMSQSTIIVVPALRSRPADEAWQCYIEMPHHLPIVVSTHSLPVSLIQLQSQLHNLVSRLKSSHTTSRPRTLDSDIAAKRLIRFIHRRNLRLFEDVSFFEPHR